MKKMNKRYWWLIEMIKNNSYTVGAEIGCANGATTHRLLKYCKDLRLFAVDKWEEVEGGPEAGDIGEAGCGSWNPVLGWQRFNEGVRPYVQRLTILRGDSAGMAIHVPDNELDFVFIDADHRYSAVIADLAAWVPKLKPGGMLCGHDIHLVGVKKAVDEKLKKYEDTGVDHVWFCKKEDYVY